MSKSFPHLYTFVFRPNPVTCRGFLWFLSTSGPSTPLCPVTYGTILQPNLTTTTLPPSFVRPGPLVTSSPLIDSWTTPVPHLCLVGGPPTHTYGLTRLLCATTGPEFVLFSVLRDDTRGSVSRLGMSPRLQ